MTLERLPLALLSIVAVLAAACAASGGANSSATTSAAVEGRVPNEEAIQQLANARCNRNERCNLIGPGKLHADRGSCDRTVQRETASDFRSADCKGVKLGPLNECANDVTKLACSLDKPTVMMVTSCNGGELCR